MNYGNRDEVERIGRAGSCLWADHKWPAYRYLSSFWLFVEPDDKAFTPHGTDGFWEAWLTLWLSKQFDKHDMFLDVGANVGYYALMAGKHGIQTTAFEPNPDIYEMLSKSIELNHVRNNVLAVQGALNDKRGRVILNVPVGHSGAASTTQDYSELGLEYIGVEVMAYPLDEFNYQGKKILMKIDAEGAEPNIWYGMQETMRNNEVTIVMEWDTRRWSEDLTYKFSYDVFMTGEVSVLNDQGGERQIVHQSQLQSIDQLEMIIVRNW